MILGTVLPEVDDLMALNPEEVAGHILVLVAPHGRLSLSGYYRQHFNPNAAAAYPRDRENDVWRAISEAWNWTESQGLLVPSDVDNFGNGFRVLSRKGEAVADPDRFRLFQEATRFPKQALHPGIRDVCWENLMRGRWDTAVFEAFRDVEVAVREAGGYTAECYGTVLMRRAFGSDGPLTDNDQVEAERDALCHLFAGAIGSYKNPHSHRVGLIDDPSECFEMLILASHLLRIVEARAPATDDDHREQSR